MTCKSKNTRQSLAGKRVDFRQKGRKLIFTVYFFHHTYILDLRQCEHGIGSVYVGAKPQLYTPVGRL